MQRHQMNDAEAIGSWDPPPLDTPYGLLTFGAQFAKVAVDADLGIIRVRHMVGAFAPGRVLNPKTARSQLMGGMLWGMSQALLEGTHMDTRHGRWANASLGDYLVPVNADAPDVDVELIEVDDHVTGPLGVKGVGEIGQVGSAAAIANAVYHATGYRVRELPDRRRAPAGPSAVEPAGRRGRSTTGPDMTGPAPSRRGQPACSAWRPEPLPGRPLLTTPPRLQHPAVADLQRQRLAAQPWLGLGGLLLAAVVFFALALGTGSTATSLLILGPISTFALPAVAMVAFWWNDWPGSRTDHALDRPDRHPPGRRGRGRADHRRPGHRRAARRPRSVRGQPRSRRPGDISGHAGPGRRRVHRHAPAVAGLRALAAGRPRAAPVRHRRARALLGDRDRRLLPVRQPRRRTGRRTGRRRAAQPGRPHRRTRLRLGPHRRRGLAGGDLHRPARLAR